MNLRIHSLAIVGVAVAVAACGDPTAANERALLARTSLASAFTTVPVGYTSAQTTYNADGAEGTGPMFPGAPMDGMGRPPHEGMGGGMGPMIGGGLGPDFLGGGMGLGHDFGHGRHGEPAVANSACTYDATAKRATCTPVTEHGLTVTRSVAWFDASGAVQSAFDSLKTNTINTQVTVSGTMTRRDSATTTISNSSDRTIGGLAQGSSTHTVNGTAAGKETTAGKDGSGAFTLTRVAADTVRGIIVPVADTGRTYPTAGTVIRVMNVTVVRTSGTTNAARREVITYDGTATAKMVITQDGTTKTCTLPLPMGRPTCS